MNDSYYNTQLAAHQKSMDCCCQIIRLWEPDDNRQDIYAKALDSGLFSTLTARSLKNVIVEIFAPRFLDEEAKPWTMIIKRYQDVWPRGLIAQMNLLQTARAHFLVRDFLEQEFWPRVEAAHTAIPSAAVQEFIRRGIAEGKTKRPWNENTIRRQASYLTTVCVDIELLEIAKRGEAAIRNFRLDWRLFLLMVCHFHEKGLSNGTILEHRDWKIFGYRPEDVANQFNTAELRPFFIIQTAGNAIEITWKLNTLQEAADAITQTGI